MEATLHGSGPRQWPIVVAMLALAAWPAGPAAADALLGPYLGAAVGQAQVAADGSAVGASTFRENHAAYQVMFGVRPVSTLGLEIDYMDFGDPSTSTTNISDVRMRGAAAFGLFYLPIPAVDVYAKVGVARLQSTVTGHYPSICTVVCTSVPFHVDSTNTALAGGVGAQLKLGGATLRAEYERFDAAGANPGLLSVGVTWSFR
jgi:hypothetical protein